jgi:predicted nucleic acid-binding protein
MARYMLDTDTCSYIMKRSNQTVVKRLRAVPVADVCISVITKSELLYGVDLRMDEVSEVWIEQCEAARDIRDAWGTRKALGYLIGEKLLNYRVRRALRSSLGSDREGGRSEHQLLRPSNPANNGWKLVTGN